MLPREPAWQYAFPADSGRVLQFDSGYHRSLFINAGINKSRRLPEMLAMRCCEYLDAQPAPAADRPGPPQPAVKREADDEW